MSEILLGNIKGKDGAGFKIIDYYDTLEALATAVTNPSVGDVYGVGEVHPYDIYIYTASGEWVNNGQLQGPQGEKGEKGDRGEKGDAGANGTSAVITGVTASIDDTTGDPNVEVTMGGTETDRIFNFAFRGLKGESADANNIATGTFSGVGATTEAWLWLPSKPKLLIILSTTTVRMTENFPSGAYAFGIFIGDCPFNIGGYIGGGIAFTGYGDDECVGNIEICSTALDYTWGENEKCVCWKNTDPGGGLNNAGKKYSYIAWL